MAIERNARVSVLVGYVLIISCDNEAPVPM